MANATISTRKVDLSKVATRYFGWIQCYGPKVNGSHPRLGACSVDGDTLPELIADAFRSGIYYLGVGYRVKLEGLSLRCATCQGQGETPHRLKNGTWTRKTCKVCKGLGVFEKFADVELTPPDSAIVCDTCMIASE
jgi:hypothetical protein